MNDKKIGIQIKKARAEAQLSQSELGRKIGVTWEMISRYENGKSSPRKNLEKIADSLGKPIQYFFGVEEVPLSEEIKKLSTLLAEKSDDLQKSAEIPFIESLENFTLSKALSYTKQRYSCPSWIYTRFDDVFALLLDSVDSDVLSIGKGDVGYFSQDAKLKIGDFVLIKDKKTMKIEKYSRTLKRKVQAVLLGVLKRYYSI